MWNYPLHPLTQYTERGKLVNLRKMRYELKYFTVVLDFVAQCAFHVTGNGSPTTIKCN